MTLTAEQTHDLLRAVQGLAIITVEGIQEDLPVATRALSPRRLVGWRKGAAKRLEVATQALAMVDALLGEDHRAGPTEAEKIGAEMDKESAAEWESLLDHESGI